MVLYFIGTGLGDEKDLSIRAVEILKDCEKIYLESYTSKINFEIKNLEKLIEKKIILSDRNMVENHPEETILKNAIHNNTAFLVIGDPFSATTHSDLFLRARKMRILIKIIHNASIMNSIGEVGLELYKYGKTTSIPFPDKGFEPETPYNILSDNQPLGLHTLILLDLRPNENRFMTIKQAIEYLIKIEEKKNKKIFSKETFCIACARIGLSDKIIKSGKAADLADFPFGEPPFCLIVPGKLHFIEEEMMELWKIL